MRVGPAFEDLMRLLAPGWEVREAFSYSDLRTNALEARVTLAARIKRVQLEAFQREQLFRMLEVGELRPMLGKPFPFRPARKRTRLTRGAR